MRGPHRIAEILVAAGVVDDMQLRSAQAQRDQWGGRLPHVLVERHFATEEAVVTALAAGLGVPRIQLRDKPKDPKALAKLDAAYCKEKGVFPVELKDNGKVLLLAMADPTDLVLVDDLTPRVRARITVMLAGEGEILAAVDRHYLGREVTAPPPRFKGATSLGEAPGEQFKVTDLSGSTRLGIAPPVPAAPVASAPDALDELLGTGTEPLSEEERTRLDGIAVNQEKASAILRALTELLTEKGLLGR
jgi:hypothetical protein